MKSYPLRRRLILSLIFTLSIILGTVGLLANHVSEHEAEEIFSARLATSARILEVFLARQLEKSTLSQPIVIALPQELEFTNEDIKTDSGHPYESKLAFQVWSSEGRLLARSASAPNEMIGPKQPGFHEVVSASALWHAFVLKSDEIWITVAERHDVRAEMADEISFSILTPLIIGGILLIIIMNLIILRSLKPLSTLSADISSRDPVSLEPITLRDAPTELEPVVTELNHLLTRVHEAFSREQRFIDSAAHELRTPIAAVQLHIQNALSAQDLVSQRSSTESALVAARRATKLADQLLFYSRITASAGMEQRESVSLCDVVMNVREMMAPILGERHQSIEISCDTSDEILADSEKAERLIRNLIENASQYGESPGIIGCRVMQKKGEMLFVVENDGVPIPDQEKQRVFIPYYRVLGAGSSGSGLGLAIVEEIVRQCGGKIRVEDKSPNNGARFVLTFPLV